MMLDQSAMKRKNPVKTAVAAAAACMLVLLGFLGLMKRYEDGILDINARQQDGYVKLVYDQIQLQKDASSDEIVSDILSSLNASSSRYWAFSDDGSIVFVKNVLETGNYQYVSMERYFEDHGSSDYLSTLHEGVVSHQILGFDDGRYVASGIRFSCSGKNYSLVLLTSVDSILENNAFLEAKTELYALIIIALIVLYLYIVGTAIAYNRVYDRAEASAADEKQLRLQIASDHEAAIRKDALDPRRNIFSISSLRHALDRLSSREEAFPLSLLVFYYGSEAERNRFLSDLYKVIDQKDILFDDPDNKMLVMSAMRTDAGTDASFRNLFEKYPKLQKLVYQSKEELKKELNV